MGVKASVIIPTYKREGSLVRTLESLVSQDEKDFEIIIVDQDSSSGVNRTNVEHFRAFHDAIIYEVFPGQNASQARNRALRLAQGEIVISCDDDIRAYPGFIRNHLRNYEDVKVGAVSGRVHCQSDLPETRIDRVGTLRTWDGKMISNFNAEFRCDIDHLYGCNASFRREPVVKAGGYDERLKGTGSFDDADIAQKLKKAGFRIVFDPGAECDHLQDSGGYRNLTFARKMYWYYHNFTVFYLTHLGKTYFPVFWVRQCFGVLRRAWIMKDGRVIVEGFCGLWDGVRDYAKKV